MKVYIKRHHRRILKVNRKPVKVKNIPNVPDIKNKNMTISKCGHLPSISIFSDFWKV